MMNITVTNLTSNVVSTALVPVEILSAPHPQISLSPLTVITIAVVVLFVFIGLIIAIRRKRRLDRLRHSLLPFYSFDANEEEDWDSDLLQNEGGTPTIRSYGSVELNIMASDTEYKKRTYLL